MIPRPVAPFFGSALFILLCLIAPSFTACVKTTPDEKKPVAVKGVIDLRGWDFESDGALSLDGEWEFCWDHILEPKDFAAADHQNECGYIYVPSMWDRHELKGARLPGKGRATYRLRILSGPDKRMKALRFKRIHSAYELWVNGTLMDKKGTTDRRIKTREDYPYIHTQRNTLFTMKEGVNEIILHVINREYKSGGIGRPLRLVDGEASIRRESVSSTIDMIVVGLLLFSAFYNIMFFFFRRVDTVALYIGFASLLFALNTYNIQTPILSSWAMAVGNPFFINYATAVPGVIMIIMIVRSLFPDDFSTGIARFYQVLCIVLIILLFFAEFTVAQYLMNVFSAFIVLLVLYILYVFIKTIRNRREDALLFFIGFLPLLIASVNNALYSLWIIDTGNAIHYGMVVICFASTLVVSRRFARALRRVEELSGDLEGKNIALEKLDRLKDQFLAITSHELRTPLQGMIGLSESMLEGEGGNLPPEARENLSLIASSGHRLTNMVNDLLDMAKIQDEGLSLNLRPLDLYSLSEMVVKLSLPLVGDKYLRIINTIMPDTSRVNADEDRIRQVLCNLVGNAVKFTGEGTVEISARVVAGEDEEGNEGAGEMVEVSVSDTGIGIPEEYREMIFEAYRQVDGSDTRSYGGTGLGLAITRQIVELHHGTIKISAGNGGGSVFSFTLPLSRDCESPVGETIVIEGLDDGLAEYGREESSFHSGVTAGDGSGSDPVFLVVDDDPVCLRVVKNYFESERCIVKTAPDGISALEILDRDSSIDLVLLDIMMPVISGFEVCRRIRLTRSPEELPVIMLTAKQMMADINAAFEAGANDYLVKPIRKQELLARAGTMLKLRRVRESTARGITIRDRKRVHSFAFDDIIHVTSHSKSCVLHTPEGTVEVPVLMKEITERLPPDNFIRIHKSHVINIRYVHSVLHVLSGRYRVRLRDEDDTELPVGPAYLDALRKKM